MSKLKMLTMKKMMFLIWPMLLAFFPHSTLLAQQQFPYPSLRDLDEKWKYIYSKDNIDVYEGKVKGEGPMAFRGVGIIKAPLLDILATLRDVDTAHEWMPNLREKRIVRIFNHADAIVYNHNHMPWPLTDRDTLLHQKLIYDKDLNMLKVTSSSVTDEAIPLYPDRVRATLYSSTIYAYPINDHETFFDFDAHFDPKGAIPNWVVNFFQQSWPYKFMTMLTQRALVNKIPHHPMFVDMVKQLKPMPANNETKEVKETKEIKKVEEANEIKKEIKAEK
jgi:hypothetical protein